MELIEKVLPRNYTLVVSSDYHFGALNCCKEAVQRMVDRVASDKNCYLVNIGDSIECILPNDKRYAHCSADVRAQLLTPQAQADKVVEIFSPISDRILAWGFGNHEYKVLNTIDFGRYIAECLGVPYGTYCFKLSAFDKHQRLMHKMFFTHGSSGGLNSNAKDDIQRTANMKAGLKHKLCKSGHGDCIAMFCGHVHQLVTVAPTIEDKLYLTDNGTGIKQHYHVQSPQNVPYIPPDARWYGCSGSFLKLYSTPGSYAITYAEVAGYSPSEIGWLEVIVEDGEMVDLVKVVA